MTANELIGILSEMVNRHGDLEVAVEDSELTNLTSIKEVCVREWSKIGKFTPEGDESVKPKTIHIIADGNLGPAATIFSKPQEGASPVP